jgi:excisionase family DNA binding protein
LTISSKNDNIHLGIIADRLEAMVARLSEIQMSLSAQIAALDGYRTDEILSATEASQFIGMKKNSLYKLVQARSIPYHRSNGKFIYFIKSELCDWVKRFSPNFFRNFAKVQ